MSPDPGRRRFLGAAGAAATLALARGAAASPLPTAAQEEWSRLGYGMFLHFGPNTIEGVGWGEGRFPAEKVVFDRLDVAQWAGVAAEAGMKYAVLTTKHVDGFCLWPSAHTAYSVKASPLRQDIVGLFVDAFRRAGLRVGFYYCLLDRSFARFGEDAVYNEYVRAQVRELLTGYGDVLQMWFDGAWVKDHPGGDWSWDPAWEKDPASGLRHGERWEWARLYALIHELQPGCLVMNNSSSDRPGWVKYHPVDARTAEHFDFVYRGRVCDPVTQTAWTRPDGTRVHLPLEYCETLSAGWFWKPADYLVHPSVAAICDWHRRARSTGSNLLLNVGPDASGLVPGYNRLFLVEAARQLGLR